MLQDHAVLQSTTITTTTMHVHCVSVSTLRLCVIYVYM